MLFTPAKCFPQVVMGRKQLEILWNAPLLHFNLGSLSEETFPPLQG